MYAIGGNEAAAEVAGVNVAATKIRIYVLASCMFGLAGCLLAAKSGGASVNTAQSYELDAIAACHHRRRFHHRRRGHRARHPGGACWSSS